MLYFFALPVVPYFRSILLADRYVYIAGIGIWGSLIYVVHKQNIWVKVSLASYLFYIIIIAVLESQKWCHVL